MILGDFIKELEKVKDKKSPVFIEIGDDHWIGKQLITGVIEEHGSVIRQVFLKHNSCA